MEKIAVIGLGYVGLPVAVAMARSHGAIVAYDLSAERVDALARGEDSTGELRPDELAGLPMRFTTDPDQLSGSTIFIVTVPTPIDGNRQPDLSPLCSACETIGRYLSTGALVIFESTVYPGVTEEVCGPLLAEVSGLRQGLDFALGYSPERINPGDREHRIETITKVVAASDKAGLERLVGIYEPVVTAGLHTAPSIKVAEAAKVIENTQRDLNIALMNELAIIFDKLGIRTKDVLDAAATKWNFLRFSPGLVGGHCIGVDPYYLTARAESVGYHPQVILAGRRINDGMGVFIAQKLVKMLAQSDVPLRRARVGVLGLTFKEDVPDLRNSRVPDILKELEEVGIVAKVHDPMAHSEEALKVFGVKLEPLERFRDMDALILAVPHAAYRQVITNLLDDALSPRGIVIDVRSMVDSVSLPAGCSYWSL